MRISNFDFTKKSSVFIIAELSANHNQDFDLAAQSIRAIKESGADAVKLQTYTPDTITIKSNKSDFIIKGSIWNGESYYSLYEKAFTPWEWHEDLMNLAKELGLIAFSSPFDSTAVDFLEKLNVPAYKIASFEITDIPLIKYVASKQKPVILSTGIATLEDIELAISACKEVGNHQIALLKCTSSYPAPIEESNLNMISEYIRRFNLITGISDHTLGTIAPVVAVAQGAKIIEKHFILDKNLGGPDASFSLDKDEFKEMVVSVRKAEKSLGTVNFELGEKQRKGKVFSRSLYITENVKSGDTVNENNVRSIRPGFGLHPKYLPEIMGKKFKSSYAKGTRMSFDLIKK